MAIVALTTDRRVNLEGNSRFQALVRAAIYNQALYWMNVDGTDFSTASDLARWAKSRFLAVGIVQNPTAIDFSSWLKQYVIILKDVEVYNDANAYNEEEVLDYMLSNGKFEMISDLVFDLRIKQIQF
jgi:hypothetical protein